MTDKTNILFLATWYPNRANQSHGIFIHRHAIAISRFARVFVLAVIPEESGMNKAIEITRGEKDGISNVIVYYRKKNKFFGWLRYIQSLCMGYKAIEKAYGRPDIVHQHVLTRFGLLALWLKRKYQIPYLVSEHWSRYLDEDTLSNYSKLLRKWLTRKVVAKASALTSVSDNLAVAMKKKGLQNQYWHLVPNVVNTSLFHLAKQKKYDRFQLLHVSNLDDRIKNISGILNALAILKKTRKDFELIVIGGKPDQHNYIEQVKRLGLTSIVHLKGFQAPEIVAQSMQNSDLFILFSHWETQGCVLLEAMACGCPIIASRVGGIPEIINDANGRVVADNDVEALASQIDKMLNNLDLYNREEIAENISRNFSMEIIGKKFMNIYSDILNRAK